MRAVIVKSVIVAKVNVRNLPIMSTKDLVVAYFYIYPAIMLNR